MMMVDHVWNMMAHGQKPDLVFQWKGWIHLNRQGLSVQSTADSRGVRISGSNGSRAGYTMFWGRVQDYWLPTPLASFPFTSPTVRHRVPSGFNCALPTSEVMCRKLRHTLYWQILHKNNWKIYIYTHTHIHIYKIDHKYLTGKTTP